MTRQKRKTREELQGEIEQLRLRLDESEQTLEAIRSGDVDALVVSGPQGDRIFSLTGAESIYRLIYETMNEAALTVALDGTILFCNRRFCELIKNSMEDCVGSKLARFVAPAQQLPLKNLLAEATTGPAMRHMTMRATDGSSVSMQIAVSTILNDADLNICLLATDLTELELQAGSIATMLKQQQALEEKQAELQEANASLRNSRLAALNLMQDAVASRKELEESTRLLRNSEQRMQQALQVSRSFTFEWHPDTDQVIRSDSCGVIFNLSGDEAVYDTGKSFFQRIHPDDRVRFERILSELTPASESYTTDYRVKCDNGGEIVLEETGRAYFHPDGRLQRLVGVSTDITARKKAEVELSRANDELEQRVAERTAELTDSINCLQIETMGRELAELSLREEITERLRVMEALRENEHLLLQQARLAAMGEMINNISHQWRQPLNALGLIIQKMLFFYDSDQFSKEFLEKNTVKSMELIQHMSRTIDDFSNFFRFDKEMEPFELNQVISNMLSLINQNILDRNIEVVLHVDGNPMVFGYPNEYAQVIMNILTNAVDALSEHKIDDARISLHAFVDGDNTVLTVTDNALGIPEEIIGKLFDPYFTTKGPDKGTGLGLFMSKMIIEKNMGGRLSVRNTGNGAEFRIEVANVGK